MKTIQDMINGVIAVEGGYTVDTGGPTMYGITEKVARDNGYKGDMRYLPREVAYDIYYKRYVMAPGFHSVNLYSPEIAEELIDTGVNMGVGVASQFLQRALNQLENSKLKVDGKLGPASISALRGYLAHRKNQDGTKVLLKVLNSFQCVRYIELCEKDDKYDKYLFGWISNRVEI